MTLASDISNALFVLHSIVLSGSIDAPMADGGEMRQVLPWRIVDERLTAMTYQYEI